MTLSEIIEIANKSGTPQDDYINQIWETPLSVKEKIILSLQLFDIQPTYHVLTNMWLEYRVSNNSETEINKLIYEKYQKVLSQSEKDPKGGMEYSLFFDIFQSEDIQNEAWSFFLNNNPNDRFLTVILANSSPIPYHIKAALYKKLINNIDFHIAIYKSIRDSCTYTRGYNVELDKPNALQTILNLNLDEHIQQLDKEKGREKYAEIIGFLSTQNGG